MNVTTTNEFRTLCRKEGVSAKGTKSELAKRLAVCRTSRSDKFIGGGRVKCKICNWPARVTGTSRKLLDGGKQLITRQIVCTGKHRHTYPLKEIV